MNDLVGDFSVTFEINEMNIFKENRIAFKGTETYTMIILRYNEVTSKKVLIFISFYIVYVKFLSC